VGAKAGDNVVVGGAGNDSITAGYGADTVFGGVGDDHVRGYGSVGLTPGATVGYRNMDRADLLFGGDGNDTIEGGGGDDRLSGDAGVDILTGGPGADTFVFNPPDTGQGEGNRDVVTDFTSGVDVLDVTGYRTPSVTWAYDEAADRVVVTIADPRGATSPGFGPYEIELAGVQSLAPGDILA
jgi:Ca2+-binding RTX toxin-like protein